MMSRIVVVVIGFLALVALDRPADACCLGCPCTKYKPRTVTVKQPVYGYTRSVRGALPKWSVERITKFLTAGTWTPNTTPPRGVKVPTRPPHDGRVAINYQTVRALPLRFATAEQASTTVTDGKQRLVLIRRIEKQGTAILVEVDDEVWKLAACSKKAGFACLVSPGTLQLAPIPPPGDGFAKPPETK